MRRFLARTALLSAVIAVPAIPAQAQYFYPGGYGGWGGWGGGGETVQGSIARGMGVYAAGAGAYNVQTAQANSINADTIMRANEYLWESQQVSNRRQYERMAQRQQQINATADATYKRLRDNPTARDIRTGDALNVVLDELTNPQIYGSAVQRAEEPVPSQLVRNIPFQYAAKMIAICLEDVSARGVPDALATNPAFESDRKSIKAIAATVRNQLENNDQVTPETLRQLRESIKTVREKVAKVLPNGTRDRTESDNFLKALYGLTKMLETPAVDKFLVGLNKYPTAKLGLLISFMQSMNLRFGAAKTPAQETAYNQLYPMLVALRDRTQVAVQLPSAAPTAPHDPQKMTRFFSGMDYNHFQPQPDPHAGAGAAPAPPAPAQPQ